MIVNQLTLDIAIAQNTLPASWLAWDDTCKHYTTGLTYRGADAVTEALAAEPWLTQLDGWSIFYDPRCPSSLNSYTATHQDYDAIAAKSIPELALLAYHAPRYEEDYPDVTSDLFDRLFLAGWVWGGAVFARGSEILDADEPIGVLELACQ